MIDLGDILRMPGEQGAAERVRAESYEQSARLEISLEGLLRSMGDSPTEVADLLRVRGIKGVRGISWMCPVARYVGESFTGTYVESYSEAVSLRQGDGFGNVVAWVDTPHAVRRFVSDFDDPHGPFADLVEPVSRRAVRLTGGS